MQKTLTIALATAKEVVRQPAFFVLAFIGVLFLIVTIFVPYFTFGEELKVYKDTGLTTVTLACLILSLLSSSSTVADEIEGRTAITLLSKPINRRNFILGKFLGIELGVLSLLLVLGSVFSLGIWYKFGYDLRDTPGAAATTDSIIRIRQVEQILPGLALGFFEVTVLTAISVAISTRLPLLVNVVLCITIFFLGHLTPILVKVTEGTEVNELIRFMAQLFGLVLPSLEFFNGGPSISTGVVIPWVGYVLPALVLCVMYTTVALLLALILFEDRDLA